MAHSSHGPFLTQDDLEALSENFPQKAFDPTGSRHCPSQPNGVGYSPFAVSSAKAAATKGRSSR